MSSVGTLPPDVLSPLWWVGGKMTRTHCESPPPSLESPLEGEREGPVPEDTPPDGPPLSKRDIG